MKKILLIAITTLLVLGLNGCGSRFIKVPCKYPNIKKIQRPTEKKIDGYTKCKAFKKGEWLDIGRCIDYKNTLILKAQNKKLKRVIKGYETKLDLYQKKYIDINQSKGVLDGII